MSTHDPFRVRSTLTLPDGRRFTYYSLKALSSRGIPGRVERLPVSLRIVLESLLRNLDGVSVRPEDVEALVRWNPLSPSEREIPFRVGRVVMQDFTGVPGLVDLAAMREALVQKGGDPDLVNPRVPVDLVVDHSVQVDFYGSPEALRMNMKKEFERNRERYEFLRWGERAFRNFRVIPPGMGIIHQVNLEYLAQVVLTERVGEEVVAFPDTLVGTDSHTTMINGLGVVGWGVGGIEAEAAMLGQPVTFATPKVTGVHLRGRLSPGVTATDLVLTVTEVLRKEGVVGEFVEFFGEGARHLTLPDRATVANMAPEYGATIAFFPPDEEVLEYLLGTGRDPSHVELVREYLKAQGILGIPDAGTIDYSRVVEIDLSSIEPSVAGPRLPQQRIGLSGVKGGFERLLDLPPSGGGFGVDPSLRSVEVEVEWPQGERNVLTHGSVVLAAITSCTNTSNPSVMVAAGLVARRAVERGLRVPGYVKTSLAPGSRAVTDYLERSGLLPYLEKLGFSIVGYGCTTCIGNSGPLPPPVEQAIRERRLVVASVLSGNRNFEARIHPDVRANYLMSPPLVVAYALAGTIRIDLAHDPIGKGLNGEPIYLRDLWPKEEEIQSIVSSSRDPQMYRSIYSEASRTTPEWEGIPPPLSKTFPWSPTSTYLRKPPFFERELLEESSGLPIRGARALLLLGDDVTTDHISPAGSIPKDSPAGRYLVEKGVPPEEFNQYGTRRGNDEVMTRGTFAHPRIRNALVDREGGYTRHFPSGEILTIFEASRRYRSEGVPLLVLAGKNYGTGSSRDWAAKGTRLLGVRAVVASSFERIHRSNLVGMGVLPVELEGGRTPRELGIEGNEILTLREPEGGLRPQALTTLEWSLDGKRKGECRVRIRLDTPMEVEYYRSGGILPFVLQKILREEVEKRR